VTAQTARQQEKPSEVELEEIRALVEKLAISDQPAVMEPPVLSFSTDTMETGRGVIVFDAREKIKIAYDAADKIKTYGKKAFPVLLEHLHDRREAVPFRAALPCDVGLACCTIIEELVLPLPEDYHWTYGWKGSDGQIHGCPIIQPGVFGSETVDSWLKAREDKTLEEIQVETLEWLIGEEKKIGFQFPEDRRMYLDPLERELGRVRKLVEAGLVRKPEPYGSYQYVIELPNVREYVWELPSVDPRSQGKPEGHARYVIMSAEGRSLVGKWLADNRDGMQTLLTHELGAVEPPGLYAVTENGHTYEYPVLGRIAVGRPASDGSMPSKEVISSGEMEKLENIFIKYGEPMDYFPQRNQAEIPPHVEPPPPGAERPER
jgi:hypothetical protein